MKIRSLAAVACVAALCACNQGQTNSAASANGATTNSSTAAPAGNTTAPAGGATAGRQVDPQLQQEISMAVQMLRPQLPLRQQTPQGTLTVSNIEANGGELIYTMEVPTDLTQESFAQFQEQLPTQACANPQARQLFERGGAYTYILKDPGGEEFRTSVSSC